MTPATKAQLLRDSLSELRGLLLTHRTLITTDIGPTAYALVVDCVTAQRDRIPLDVHAFPSDGRGK